jgi:hypothetical protein
MGRDQSNMCYATHGDVNSTDLIRILSSYYLPRPVKCPLSLSTGFQIIVTGLYRVLAKGSEALRGYSTHSRGQEGPSPDINVC